MSAQVVEFALYQKKAQQLQLIKQQGWVDEQFCYTPGKPLNIYLVDKYQPCLRLFNCHIHDLHCEKGAQQKRQQTFLHGWQLISEPTMQQQKNLQPLMFQLARRVIASLPQWKNLNHKVIKNKFGENSHLIVLIDSHCEIKPIELILVQTHKAFLSPWRIQHLLRKNRLRDKHPTYIPIWNFIAGQ